MRVDRDRFLEEGYLVVPEVVPSGRLEAVRAAYEILVERQRQIWASERKPDDPPGGAWETSAQPRLVLSRPPGDQIDARSAAAVEVWLGERAQGVSEQLLAVDDAAVTEMMLMCNPVRDHGPALWHRDMYPPYCAPLQAYVDDILETGPRYIQWNISLYDDDVLWVVPGSHARLNTQEEDEQLIKDRSVPLPGGVQTHLKAGDGVVYILPIMHWGSNYRNRKRRCIHGGFSAYTQYAHRDYIPHLSAEAGNTFARWIEQSEQMEARTEAVLRAALRRDAIAYDAALEVLRPGSKEKSKLLSTVFLSKTARRLSDLKRADFDSLPQQTRAWATDPHPMTLQWGAAFADRFSTQEAAELWQRFQSVDAAVQSETEQSAPGFQGGPSHYNFNHMPAGYSVSDFIASWDD
jgi:hypothetical protein